MSKKAKNNSIPQKKAANAGDAPVKQPPGFKWSVRDFKTQAIILAIIGFIFYCNTFSGEAAFDDRMAISGNEYVQQGLAGIPGILTKDAYQSYLEHKNSGNQLAGGRYRPLSLISFAIEQQVLGVADDEIGNARDRRIAGEMHLRHVVSVLLYILSVIALLYFLNTVIFPDSLFTGFIAALLFTIHPLHTEVVANVKSRDEILSLLFITLTFIKAFRYFDERKTKDLLWAGICFFLALLSKEYAVTPIILLPLAFFIFRKSSMAKSVRATLPYLIPLAVYLLLRFNAVTAMAEGADKNVLNNPYLLATTSQRLASELWVLLDYLRLLIFPNVLVADYSYNQLPYTDFAKPLVWLSIVVYAALVALLIIFVNRRHVMGFAIAFYLFNLLLVANLFFNIGAPMGERLAYHSSLGFCMAAAFLLSMVLDRIKQPETRTSALATVMTILILLCGFKTIARNANWKNDETLFLTDVKKAPNSVLMNNDAAAACMAEARKHAADIAVRNKWFEMAIGYLDKAISIYPGHMTLYLTRGLCYYDMGLPFRALPDWDTVRRYSPDAPNLSKYLTAAGQYFYAIGRNYTQRNMPDSAVWAYQKCTEATPEIPEAWYSLGVSDMAVGKQAGARAALARALQLAPNVPEVRKAYNEAVGAK